jgi:xanthine dehydrogenase small subunit
MTESAPVRFILDGKTIIADDIAPTTTLLDYLRENLGRTGTKEGCAEGDCGACTVVAGSLCDGGIRYRAVNACIRFVPTFDGQEIITVESLKAPDGALHPVQQAMVDYHASQCGFCTPGFVMSLFGLYLGDAAANRETVVDALSGNLCRCTGYRPIIAAALHALQLPEPSYWNRSDAQNAARKAQLKAIQRTDSLRLANGNGYAAPRTPAELAVLYLAHPDALLLAGGTDIGLWVTKQLCDLPYLIYLGDVVELDTITATADYLEIGAAVRLGDAYAAIIAHYPALAELANRFASVPIRNSGTFCGNVANGSPIGDAMPFLLALDASVVLRRGDVTRELALDAFYLGYQKKALQASEFVVAVRIPLRWTAAGCIVASYKISKRFDQDISALCGAYALHIEAGVIASARIAYGGMAATPLRAAHAEAALTGQPWAVATFDAAASALALDYKPIADMRASAAYRSEVAANLLRRLYLEYADVPTTVRVGSAAATDD